MRYESKFGIAVTVTIVVMAILIVGIEMHKPETFDSDSPKHYKANITNNQTLLDLVKKEVLLELALEKRAEEYAKAVKEKCESSGNVYTFEGNVHTCSSPKPLLKNGDEV